MYVEITKEAFARLKPLNVKCSLVEGKELCVKYYYHSFGCDLLQIDNFLSFTSQYFIRDINA